MPQAQQIVDRIKVFLASSNQTKDPFLEVLATRYASLCQEANRRLRRCEELLNKGMRTEAIYEADGPPPLLDLISLLEFPEASRWRELCLLYDLPDAPPLLTHLIQRLHEEYPKEQSIEHLLAEYRRVIQVGSTKQKIATLRKLLQSEPTNSHWVSELDTLESVRLKEIALKTEAALKTNDEKTLEQQAEELFDPAWRAKESQAYKGLRQKYALRQGQKTAEKISLAYSEFNFPELETLLLEWEMLLNEGYFTTTAELQTQVVDALEWYKREAEKKQKEEEARQALEVARKFKRYLMILLPSGVLLLLIILWIVYRGIQSQKIREWYRSISTASYEEKNYLRADQLLHDLERSDPALYQHPVFQNQRHEVDEHLNKIEQAHQRFQTIMVQLERVRQGNFQSPLPLEALLQEAESLVQDKTEQARWNDFDTALETFKHQAQQKRDGVFKDHFEAIEISIDKLNQLIPRKEAEKYEQRMKSIFSQMDQASNMPGVSRDLKERTLDLLNRQRQESEATYQKALNDIKTRNDQLKDIYSAFPDMYKYETALNNYIRISPDEDEVPQFKKLSEQFHSYLALLSFNKIPIPEKISDDLAPAQNFLAQPLAINSIWAAPLKRYLDSLSLDNNNDKVHQALQNLSESKSLYDMAQISIGGNIYYYAEPSFQQGSVSGEICFSVFNLKTCQTEIIDKCVPFSGRNPPQGTLLYHSRYVRDFLGRLSQPQKTERGYDLFLLSEIRALQADPQMDPIVKAYLLRLFFEKAQSVVHRQEYLPPLKNSFDTLGQLDLNYCWISNEPEVNQARRNIVGTLLTLPDLKPMFQSLRLEKELLKTSLKRKVEWVGLVQKNGDQVRLDIRLPKRPEEVWILRVDIPQPQFVIIAEKKNTEYEIDPAVTDLLFEGQPIFAPTDGLNTKAVLEEMTGDLKLNSDVVNNFKNWPESWPVNARTLKK